MANVRFNINNDEAVKHTVRLERLHKSGLPTAIRQTLNAAAKDVKFKTMPKSAARQFTQRNPTFFKASSGYELAKGWDINKMKSAVGFNKNAAGRGKSKAIEELEQQEYGGIISKRGLIPLNTARENDSDSGQVLPKNRLRRIDAKNVISTRGGKGKSKKQRFIRAAFKAKSLYKGQAFVKNVQQGRITVSRIISAKKIGDGVKIERTPLYSYKKGRSVNISGTGFMRRASFESGLKMDAIYRAEAEKQILRLRNK